MHTNVHIIYAITFIAEKNLTWHHKKLPHVEPMILAGIFPRLLFEFTAACPAEVLVLVNSVAMIDFFIYKIKKIPDHLLKSNLYDLF